MILYTTNNLLKTSLYINPCYIYEAWRQTLAQSSEPQRLNVSPTKLKHCTSIRTKQTKHCCGIPIRSEPRRGKIEQNRGIPARFLY